MKRGAAECGTDEAVPEAVVSKKAGKTGKRKAEVTVGKEEGWPRGGLRTGEERTRHSIAELCKRNLVDERRESERILPGPRACEFVTLRSNVSGAAERPSWPALDV